LPKFERPCCYERYRSHLVGAHHRDSHEQQHRIDDLNGRLIRLETIFEIALNRSSVQRNLE